MRRARAGASDKADAVALPAVQTGRCKASGIGRDGMAGDVCPAGPRRLLRRFGSVAVRSYALFVTRDRLAENSASVSLASHKGENPPLILRFSEGTEQWLADRL